MGSRKKIAWIENRMPYGSVSASGKLNIITNAKDFQIPAILPEIKTVQLIKEVIEKYARPDSEVILDEYVHPDKSLMLY